MKRVILLLIPILLSGCGVPKATHTKALESVQRLTAERDTVNERFKALSAELEKVKAENATLSTDRNEIREKLKKVEEELKQCTTQCEAELAALKGKAAKADKLEEELNLLMIKLKEIRTRTETLLGEITDVSR